MQQLPDQFNSDPNIATTDIDTDANSMSYEPINAGARDSAVRYAEKPALPIPLAIAISVLLSLIINVILLVATSDKTVAKLGMAFGLKNTSEELADKKQASLDRLNVLVAEHTDLIAQINISLRSINQYIGEVKNSLAENDARIARAERNIEEVALDITKSKIPRAASKPVAIAKPKAPPKPQIFISLLSIRSQGGSPWVTLREGLDTSPLMTIGDEWRTVKLVSADTNSRSAQISINGTVMVVKL